MKPPMPVPLTPTLNLKFAAAPTAAGPPQSPSGRPPLLP